MNEAVLQIPAYLLDRIGAHARSEHPRECCGFLTGPVHGGPERFVPVQNVHADPTRYYAMDPDAVLAAFREMDRTGHDALVVYHSHTGVDSRLSSTDILSALDLRPVYLVCSTARSTTHPTFQAWRIAAEDGSAEGKRSAAEVALDIVDANHPESPLAGLVEGNRVRVVYDGMGGRRTVVATVGSRNANGEGVVLHPVRPGASGHVLTVALDRIRSVGVLEEGANAADTRRATARLLQEAATRLLAQDTVGARGAVGRAQAMMPRIVPPTPPVPRAYRPRRKGE